jgi:hypothetical protein
MKRTEPVVHLTKEESQNLLKALTESPEPPSPAVVAALKRYRRSVCSGVNPEQPPIRRYGRDKQ